MYYIILNAAINCRKVRIGAIATDDHNLLRYHSNLRSRGTFVEPTMKFHVDFESIGSEVEKTPKNIRIRSIMKDLEGFEILD